MNIPTDSDRSASLQATPELVRRKVREYWPDRVEEEMTMLQACVASMNADHSSKKGRSRVQLAVIKLTDGSFAELEEYIDMARADYRDVLAYAEYPEQMKLGFAARSKLSAHQPDELRSIMMRDRQQYEARLTRDMDE